MAPGFDDFPPHRRLVAFLETALDALGEAAELDGYLPHHTAQAVRRMAEELAELCDRLGREASHLAVLTDAELGADPEAEGRT
jgi:hypothetical protein